MKRTIVVYLTLCVSLSPACASLMISGIPGHPCDESSLEIVGDGRDPSPVACWLLVERCGSISGGTVRYQGSLSDYWDLEEVATRLGMTVPEVLSYFEPYGYRPIDLAFITLADGSIPPKPLIGVLVQDIIFEIGRCYEADLTLIDADLDSRIVYSQTTSHIPEPATAVLVGCGALLLRKLGRRQRQAGLGQGAL